MLVGIPELDEVGARDDSQEVAVLDHRHLAEVVLDHHALHLVHRVVGLHEHRAGVHEPAHRHVAEAMVQGSVHITAREDARQPILLHHREALVAVALHELAGLAYRGARLHCMDVHRHNRAHAHGRYDVGLQGAHQARAHVVEALPLHQRGGRLGVPAAAELAQHPGDVDGVGVAAGDELYVAGELGQKKAGVRLVEG